MSNDSLPKRLNLLLAEVNRTVADFKNSDSQALMIAEMSDVAAMFDYYVIAFKEDACVITACSFEDDGVFLALRSEFVNGESDHTVTHGNLRENGRPDEWFLVAEARNDFQNKNTRIAA